MWYKIDFNKLVLLLLPTFLRKPKLVAFIQALFKPLASLHYKWQYEVRDFNINKLSYNGQLCYLRKALNDRCDKHLRRIYIRDGNSFPRKYIYTRAENKPVYIGKLFIYQKSEYANSGADFIVYVPAHIINTRIFELEALIEFYKLASKRYQIVPI